MNSPTNIPAWSARNGQIKLWFILVITCLFSDRTSSEDSKLHHHLDLAWNWFYDLNHTRFLTALWLLFTVGFLACEVDLAKMVRRGRKNQTFVLDIKTYSLNRPLVLRAFLVDFRQTCSVLYFHLPAEIFPFRQAYIEWKEAEEASWRPPPWRQSQSNKRVWENPEKKTLYRNKH